MPESRDEQPPVPGAQFDPVSTSQEWVPVAHAAKILAVSETWILEQCHDGRLPSRRAPGREGAQLTVPLSTARALAIGEISD